MQLKKINTKKILEFFHIIYALQYSHTKATYYHKNEPKISQYYATPQKNDYTQNRDFYFILFYFIFSFVLSKVW